MPTKEKEGPGALYELLVENNQVAKAGLKENSDYLEDWAFVTEIDPDLIRAVILHESRGWGTVGWGQELETVVSQLRSGDKGSFGYAQVGGDARKEIGLSKEDVASMRGSIEAAARWLQVSKNDLQKAGLENPSVAQIATQYNNRKANGLISEYGKQVLWTYEGLKNKSQ